MLRIIDAALAAAACLLLAALLVVVSLGVITRGLDDPLIWTDEASRFLMIWLACAGWIITSRKQAHIRIRFLVNLVPSSVRRGTEFLMQIAVLLFGALVVRYAWELVDRNGTLMATTVPLPMSALYAPLVVVGIATVLQGLGEIVALLRPGREGGAAVIVE